MKNLKNKVKLDKIQFPILILLLWTHHINSLLHKECYDINYTRVTSKPCRLLKSFSFETLDQ